MSKKLWFAVIVALILGYAVGCFAAEDSQKYQKIAVSGYDDPRNYIPGTCGQFCDGPAQQNNQYRQQRDAEFNRGYDPRQAPFVDTTPSGHQELVTPQGNYRLPDPHYYSDDLPGGRNYKQYGR